MDCLPDAKLGITLCDCLSMAAVITPRIEEVEDVIIPSIQPVREVSMISD